jgi:hypothetical protein
VGAATSRKATAALEHLDGCAATLDQLDELHSRFVRISLLLSRPPPRWDLDQLNELHSRSVGISLLLSRPLPAGIYTPVGSAGISPIQAVIPAGQSAPIATLVDVT